MMQFFLLVWWLHCSLHGKECDRSVHSLYSTRYCKLNFKVKYDLRLGDIDFRTNDINSVDCILGYFCCSELNDINVYLRDLGDSHSYRSDLGDRFGSHIFTMVYFFIGYRRYPVKL